MFHKKHKVTEKCKLGGKHLQKRVCFKDTDNHGVMYGYVRHNKVYTQVVYKNNTWHENKKHSFLASLFSLVF